MAFFEAKRPAIHLRKNRRGEGVSSATTDLDQKYLLQNQSQRHQYFITGEPAGRRTHTPPHRNLSFSVLSFPRLQFCLPIEQLQFMDVGV